MSQEKRMIAEVSDMLEHLKAYIEDDYVDPDDYDGQPGLDVTVASDDGDEWTYQTGSNEYMGSCYHYRFWGVGRLYRDSDCNDLAADLVGQIFDQLAEANF